MKNKKFSVALTIVSALCIILILLLNHLSKNRISLENSKGDIKNLGNVSIVYDANSSLLGKDKVIMHKEGISYNKDFGNKKFDSNSNIEKNCIYYRSVSNALNYENLTGEYKTKKYHGTVSLYGKPDNYNNDIPKLFLEIEHKNIINNKVNNIKLPIKGELKKKSLDIVASYMYKNKLYVVLKEYNEKDNQGKLYYLEVDVNRNSYKVLNELNLEIKENDTRLTKTSFLNDGKIYVEIEKSSKISNTYRYFTVYDIKSNSITNSNKYIDYKNTEDTNLSSLIDYVVKDNKITILSHNKLLGKQRIIKTEFAIDTYEINKISQKKYDLDYDLFSQLENDLNLVEFIDEKVYSITLSNYNITKQLKNRNRFEVRGLKDIKLNVFDINKEKVVYKTNIVTGEINPQYKFSFAK